MLMDLRKWSRNVRGMVWALPFTSKANRYDTYATSSEILFAAGFVNFQHVAQRSVIKY